MPTVPAAPAALAVRGPAGVLRQLEALPPSATGAAAAKAAALPGIGVALLLAGRHQEAAGIGRALLALDAQPAPVNAWCWGHLFLGAVRYEWDDLPAAAEPLRRARGAPMPTAACSPMAPHGRGPGRGTVCRGSAPLATYPARRFAMGRRVLLCPAA